MTSWSYPELKDRVGPAPASSTTLPAACHIAYNYNTPVDVNALKKEFERIRAAVRDEFDWLYCTEHYEPAIGDYALTSPEVLSRLRNPPPTSQKDRAPSTSLLEENAEVPKTWTLLSRSDVEQRLGYSVSDLPRDKAWKNIDVSQIEEWICIPATIQYTIWSDVYRCEGLVTIEKLQVSQHGAKRGQTHIEKRVFLAAATDIVLFGCQPGRENSEEQTFCPIVTNVGEGNLPF